MNTNPQTHYELIWSFQFDKTSMIITAVVMVAFVVASLVFAKKRRSQ